VVDFLPRYGLGCCNYFQNNGHCAYGLGCHKAHDPSALCNSVKARLCVGDFEILNEHQQQTLHIAMVEETMSVSELQRHFKRFGALRSVKIEQGKTLLRQETPWR
jgi:hypothetical protein